MSDVADVEILVAIVEECDWYGLDPGGWWVVPGVCAEFLHQMKVNASQVVKSGSAPPTNGRAAYLHDVQSDPLREYL